MVEQETGTKTHKERQGVVVSKSGNKSIVVVVEERRRHVRYDKVMWRSSKFHVHDEKNEAKVGDRVRITECRPISRLKRWRLLGAAS
ncbi:MAG: 30S ribosomal protein S17 [Lentisphaerae bacterium]|nr:30S ribosomal protein S17 [Lentisphaerota bacterium]